MLIEQTQDFQLPLEEVFALMRNETFQRRKAEALGALQFEFEATDGAAPRIVTKRKLPTAQLPEFIKPMLQPTMMVTETEEWTAVTGSDPARHGRFTIDVSGAPVHLDGQVSLVPHGNHGTTLTFSGELRSAIPMFRRQIENAAAGSIIHTITTEFALLRRHEEWANREVAINE